METSWMLGHMTADDVPAVAALEAENFSRPWSYEAFLDLLSDENYIVLLAKERERVLGYCVLLCTGDEADITNVCTAPAARRRGVGEALLTALIEAGKERGVTEIFLEVRESNVPARSLYEKLGFEEIGLRKNYYEEPKEHAVIMKKTTENTTTLLD